MFKGVVGIAGRHNSLHRVFAPGKLSRPLLSAVAAAIHCSLFSGVLILAATITAAAQAGADKAHMVFVSVSVAAAAGRAVTGLKPEDFTVFDGKTPEAVSYLSPADEPVSLVVVFDASADTPVRIRARRKALAELISTSSPQDEFGLVVLHNEARIVVPLGGSRSEIERIADATQTGASRTLWDGMFLGLKELQLSHYPRKAMVVISDAGDEGSRHKTSELKKLLRQTGVDVYGIGRFDRYAPRLTARTKALQLDEVLTTTGGRGISACNEGDFVRAAGRISQELHNQYVLGYYPAHRNPDGEWREPEVRLSKSVTGAKLLHCSQGCYAAPD